MKPQQARFRFLFGDAGSRETGVGHHPIRRENLSGELQGESGESQPTEPTDDAEARADFWSIQGVFINRHRNEPRVQLHVPKEETFPIPLKNINVTRSTHADLDVMQEKKIDDYWNVDWNRPLSDFLERIHKVYSVERETSKRIFLVRGEIDKDSSDYQTRSCMAGSLDENW